MSIRAPSVNIEGIGPFIAMSPAVSHASPACVRLQTFLVEETGVESYIIIGLYQSSNGSNTINTLGQITTVTGGKHQVTLPTGTYRLLLVLYNYAHFDVVSIRNITLMAEKCTDDGKQWLFCRLILCDLLGYTCRIRKGISLKTLYFTNTQRDLR